LLLIDLRCADHLNYVGHITVDKNSQPVVLSILTTKTGECRALLRTQLGNSEVPIPAAKIKSPTPTPDDLLAAFASSTSPFCPSFCDPFGHFMLTSIPPAMCVGDYQLDLVEDPEIMFELLEYEKNDPQRTTSLPIGIVYARQGDTTAAHFWESANIKSSAFESFLRRRHPLNCLTLRRQWRRV
jgi:hypothetical protein